MSDHDASWRDDIELQSMLVLLAGRTGGLTNTDGDLIQSAGIGCNCNESFVNNVFALRDYCWCEGSYHRETVLFEDDEDAWQLAIETSGGSGTGCPPNFEHFASGIKGSWYKHLGRDVTFNREARRGEALNILMECLLSLG